MPEELMVTEEPEQDFDDDNSDQALADFKLDISNDADHTQEQRELANEDAYFVNVAGGMWDGWQESLFANRCKPEFDLITDYINRFIGEWNLNRVGVEYKPDDDKTSDDDAELLNGIYRADFRQFSGKMALDNAVDDAAGPGYGALKLGTIFEDEEDPDNELQRIDFRPIEEAYNRVFWDRGAKRIDKLDARRCTTLEPFTRKAFEKAYPGKSPVSAYTPWTGDLTGWSLSGTQDVIYIATRYQVVKEEETIFKYFNLLTEEEEVYTEEDHKLIEDAIKKDPNRELRLKKKLIKRKVMKSVFSGKSSWRNLVG